MPDVIRKLIVVTCWLVLAGCTIPSTPVPTRTATFVPTATATLTPSPTFTPTPQPIPPAESGDIPNLACFYKPFLTPVTIADAVQYCDTWILTFKDETYRDNLRALGETIDYQYLRGEAIADPDNAFAGGTCSTVPFGNSVAYLRGDACLLRDTHPDYFLRDTSGAVIRDNGYLLMDFGNADYQQWFIRRIRQMQRPCTVPINPPCGWTAVFLDNIPAARVHTGRMLRDYPDDASYQDAVVEFLEAVKAGIGETPLGINLIYQTSYPVYLRYAAIVDLVMDEAAFAGWQNSFWNASKWLQQIETIEAVLSSGTEVMAVTQGTPTDINRFRFAYATYLLIATEGLSWRYSNAQNGGYRQFWHYPELDYDLGQPLDERELMPDGVTWFREFEHGIVRVNPVSHASEIVINP